MKTPNILFIIADDWSRLAQCYGNSDIHTPNIDAFARQSTIFNYGFCTSPSCAVSRACILTGLHSHQHGQYGHCHGIHGFRTHEWLPSLPKLLRQAGYATACLGKMHVAPATVYPWESVPKVNPRHLPAMALAARQFLADNRERPFYLHVGLSHPHRIGRTFGNEEPWEGLSDKIYDPASLSVPPWLPDVPRVRAELADYYRAVTRFDAGVGAMLQALEDSGRADDTLVIVTSDHAMPFPGCKASSYDTGHHCPLLIRHPGAMRRGHHNNALVNWLDFMPTLLTWAGQAVPAGLTGRNLLPILDETDPAGFDEVYFSHNFHEVVDYYPYRVLRQRHWKYVKNLCYHLPVPLPTDLYRSETWQAVREQGLEQLGQRPSKRILYREPEELFDLEADPLETRNLALDRTHRKVLSRLRAQVQQWREATKDPWLELSFQAGECPDPGE